jgi:superoxide dismutase, Cu-Zn family
MRVGNRMRWIGVPGKTLVALLILSLAAGCGQEDEDSERGLGDWGESPGEELPPREEADTRLEPRTPDRVEVQMVDTLGESIGTVVIEDQGDGIVLFVSLAGLEEGRYALHIHEHGTCDGPDFESAGAHFAPEGREHGFQNPAGPHAGDLPNVEAGEDGVVQMEIFNSRLTVDDLRAGDGTSLVLHVEADDYVTDPSGDAGDRQACGVISPTNDGSR